MSSFNTASLQVKLSRSIGSFRISLRQRFRPALFGSLLSSFSLLSSLVGATAHAQSTENRVLDGKNAYDFGLDFGTLIPSRTGLQNLVPGWGIRASAPTEKGIFEAHFFSGIGNGIVYRTVGLDFRMDLVFETIDAHALLGIHGDSFDQDSPQVSKSFAGGWHYGGGISLPVAGPILLRFDFRHRFSPGQVVEVTVGITYRFASAGGG